MRSAPEHRAGLGPVRLTAAGILMVPAAPLPDADPASRLRALIGRWELEERALATVLTELDREHDGVERDRAYYRILDEARPELDRRHTALQSECCALADELAHVRLALTGARDELRRQEGAGLRTPA